MARTPAKGEGGGGFRIILCEKRMLSLKAQEHKFWPEKVFSTKHPTPQHMCRQNDQRDVGIILSQRCIARLPPPPPRHGR